MDSKEVKRIWFTIVEHDFNKLDSLVHQAVTQQADEIVLLGETEWLVNIKPIHIDLLNQHNIKIRILHGCGKNQYYIDYYKKINFDINNVEFWNTYWFNWGSACLLGSKIDYRVYEPDSFQFKHSFISLNNRRHIHRCIFIDELAKNNLLDKGIVTWTNFLNENANYKFNYFHGKQMLLDDDFINKLDSFLLPVEWHQSLFHVVTEATHEAAFPSEKTTIPILMKKPFIVFSCVDFHKMLTELGFKLYDEVIDYSFDSEPNIEIRAEKFTKNVSKIVELDKQATYNLLKPKLLYNYNRAIEIIKSKHLIPQIVKERLAEANLKDNTLLVDGRFEMFMNNCND
jgi:hypothetical protein